MITIRAADTGSTESISIEAREGGSYLLRIESRHGGDGQNALVAEILLPRQQAQFLGLLLSTDLQAPSFRAPAATERARDTGASPGSDA
jgi:hypothetical protein